MMIAEVKMMFAEGPAAALFEKAAEKARTMHPVRQVQGAAALSLEELLYRVVIGCENA